MIKAILFDIGGVIGDFDHEKFKSFIISKGGNYIEGLEFFKKNKWKANKGLISIQEYWNQYMIHTGITSNIEEIHNHYPFYVNKEVLQIIKQLKKEGYQLFIGSDIDEISIQDVFKVLDKNLFDTIFLSYEVKEIKRNKEFFEHILLETGLEPNDIFYIDDREEEEGVGKSVGLKTHQFTNIKCLKKELTKIQGKLI